MCQHFVQQRFTHVTGIKDGLFEPLDWERQDANVKVFWNRIDTRKQSAFIRGYVLFVVDNNRVTMNFSTGIMTRSSFLMIDHK